MEFIGVSLYQNDLLDIITSNLNGATGVEGVILSNQNDFNTKKTAVSVKNTTQDNTLSALETKAIALESTASGLEERNMALDAALLVVQSREDALSVGAAGLESRAVGFNTNITSINDNLNGNIQEQINMKVTDSIFQSLKTEFETDFANFQIELNQKVVTATQEVLDARQDSDDAVLEKKFCSIEEFAQTFLQTYDIKKPDGSLYRFNGKIQNISNSPPIFHIIEKVQNTTTSSTWDLKIKLTDYGYNVMSGKLIVKSPTGTVLYTLVKSNFDSTTKLYTLALVDSNSNGTLIGGPYIFEYQASTSTVIYSLILDSNILNSIPEPRSIYTWNQMGVDIDGEAAGDFNGWFTSLNNDGTILAIGARYNDGNTGNINDDRGHVRVYEWKETIAGSGNFAWIQRGDDIDGEAAGDLSGTSVSLSSDGNTLSVGAIFNDVNTGNINDNRGHVRVYDWKETIAGSGNFAWIQRGDDIDGEAAGDYSGYFASLSSDGNVVAIDAFLNDGNGIDSGHVRVYEWKETIAGSGNFAWTQRGNDIDGEAAGDSSGISINLNDNGTVLAIGAPYNSSSKGHVRVYEWKETIAGTGNFAWIKRGDDIDGEAAGDRCGWSVNLSSDGSVLAVGAIFNDGNTGNINDNRGHVRVYEWKETIAGTGNFAWIQRGDDIDGEAAGDQDGHSVFLSNDGSVLAVGAWLNDGLNRLSPDTGRVRVYKWKDTGSGTFSWVQIGQDLIGEGPGDQNGFSVSLNSDGSILAVGAFLNDGNTGFVNDNRGHVRVYQLG